MTAYLPANGRDRLHRQSLGNQIASQLRQEILLGRLAPGTPVSQQALCETYGTSRMPVRDALVRLTNEGLIETTPGGQSVIAHLTKQDIIDAFDVEALVHGRAARRAATNATQDELTQLETLHHAMTRANRSHDLAELGELNWRFHKQINLMARSAKLLAVVRSVSLDIPQGYLSELPGWADKSNHEHAGILEAMRAGDGERSEALVHQHVRDAGANLAAYLEDKGLFAAAPE